MGAGRPYRSYSHVCYFCRRAQGWIYSETSTVTTEDATEDNFDKIYKGEISKSGTAILPSKRIRRMPEKANLDSKVLTEEHNKEKEEMFDWNLTAETILHRDNWIKLFKEEDYSRQ